MPHLNVEFSSNIIEKNDMVRLFKACHIALSNMLPTNLENCKSRVTENDVYYLGDGSKQNAFVHASLKILPGRTPETIQALADAMLQILKNHFTSSLEKLNLQITLEIAEAEKTYFKLKV